MRTVHPEPLAQLLVPLLEKLLNNIPTGRANLRNMTPLAASHLAIRKAAGQSALISGAASLPPGPLGMLALVPDLMSVWKIQSQLVVDIAALHNQPVVTQEVLMHCLFRHGLAQAGRGLSEKGLEKLAMTLAGRVATRTASKWIPVAGAIGVAGYTWYDTRKVGLHALRYATKQNSIFKGE